MVAAALLGAVDPVPWARAQMALTLAVHIVLVPLGVSWGCLTLAANHRAIRHDDPDALRLAQRWSKYMAVTFAVGAVTGTVLSFEFGLLWPRFMDRFGAAFGIPFAVEGLFFFIEAIFLAIYIYGWKRLRPWPHFWSGVPIVIAGIGGTASVMAANAWMNHPAGFTLDQAGRVVDVDPIRVIFNPAMVPETVHMLVAAYLVGGFLIASVYAVALLRGKRDRYHRLGFLIPFTVAAIAAPLQLAVGDTLARWVQQNEPTKFAAMELVGQTRSDVPETLGGRIGDDGKVTGGIDVPGVASWLSSPSKGSSTVIQGLDAVPADERPTTREVNTVHLAWDVMVGLGTALVGLSAWFGWAWWRRRDLPRSRWFLRAAAVAGVASVLAMEAGWTVTEVGRQPWIVVGHMRVADAATENGGVWVTFLAVTALYAVMVAALIGVLRAMARRFARADDIVGGGPYSPRRAADRPPGGADA